jgi:subtilisin family serine protease
MINNRRKLFASLGAAVATLLFAFNSLAAEYRPNQVIVQFKDGTVRTRSLMNPFYVSMGVTRVQRFGGNLRGMELFTLKDSIKVEDAVAELQRSELVAFAQPNYILKLMPNMPAVEGAPVEKAGIIDLCKQFAPAFGLPPELCDLFSGGLPGIPGFPGGGGQPVQRPDVQPAPAETIPGLADPDNAKAYGLTKIGALQAHTDGQVGSKNIIVAVIDTGIDYNHEDLAFNVWRNPNPTNSDLVGWDVVNNDGLPFDDNEHGTHCAGTIGATGMNGIGVTGVNQRVSVMGIKFLSAQGSGDTAGAIKGIDYAVNNGAKVLSNSWGGPADNSNPALYQAIESAKAKDVLFIAAAGNDGKNNDKPNEASYPAAFDNDNLISVAATDSKDGVAFFSNYGKKTTHVAAPGVDIYSLKPGNQYQKLSGTSMAAPHVAGAVALIWSKNPTWTYKQVKDALMNTVDPIPALAQKTVTGGRINVAKALQVN